MFIQYYDLPKNIISNHKFPFASKFWKGLFEFLNVKVKLSSTFHPQTDGRIEQVNHVLK
jgi:hypothetical protein